jgi:trans-aconitate 2-methyltransferase
MNRDWDAVTYDRVSRPLEELATTVLDRLDLSGDETVLDAGCGSGNVTLMLLDRLPRGHVIAVDQAASMVEHAREALNGERAAAASPGSPGRATVLRSDLTELELESEVDAVFSSAVFHWIADHDRLFERLFCALHPGGRLGAQCGGEGNIERFHEAARAVGATAPYAEFLGGWAGPWNFAGPMETAARLERAGFEGVETWLEPRPISPQDPEDYLRTICLGYHLEQLPAELRDDYVRAVLARSGDELDYVRLNINARRPA